MTRRDDLSGKRSFSRNHTTISHPPNRLPFCPFARLGLLPLDCVFLALAGLVGAPLLRPNVLFNIADDLTGTALSWYGNTICRTADIDRLAARGTRFTRSFCATRCGPSRASFMSGYYPHASGVLGYISPRPQIGDRGSPSRADWRRAVVLVEP